jgi:type IV pilus assembly protein PilC
MVVNMSNWMQKYWFILNYCNCNYYLFLEAKKRSKKFRDGLDKIALKLPIFGDLVYKAIIARYSRTLATTFAAGVPLIDALESTAGATNNVIYEEAVMKIREDVATGQQLQFAMRVSNRFPSMAIQMVAIGEESGALDSMLDKVATHYENEVDNAVDGLNFNDGTINYGNFRCTCWWSSYCNVSTNFPNGFCGLMQEFFLILSKTQLHYMSQLDF